MKLSGNLYSISDIVSAPGKCSAIITLNTDCDIYKGHFPSNPITPGVALLGIAREIMEESLGCPLTLVSVPSVKYTAVLSPLEHPTATYDIAYSEDGSDIKGKVTVKDGDTVFNRMSLVWNKS